MKTILIWIVTALYSGQAGVLIYSGKPWLALVWFVYAIANVGLIYGAQA